MASVRSCSLCYKRCKRLLCRDPIPWAVRRVKALSSQNLMEALTFDGVLLVPAYSDVVHARATQATS